MREETKDETKQVIKREKRGGDTEKVKKTQPS